jgi:hypothetical protein
MKGTGCYRAFPDFSRCIMGLLSFHPGKENDKKLQIVLVLDWCTARKPF